MSDSIFFNYKLYLYKSFHVIITTFYADFLHSFILFMLVIIFMNVQILMYIFNLCNRNICKSIFYILQILFIYIFPY